MVTEIYRYLREIPFLSMLIALEAEFPFGRWKDFLAILAMKKFMLLNG